MKKALLILIAAGALAACDKSKTADPAEEPAAEETTEETAEAPAEEAEEAEPTAGAESQGEQKKAGLADDIEPGKTGFYGDRFTVIEPPITLAKAIEQSPEFDGAVKVEATVQKVCKKKGCWFTMSDGSTETEVRVKMKDYGFFVPRNADGAKVIAEGTLTSREIPVDEAKHYAEEGGGDPEKIQEPQKTWEFTATAVEIRAAEG